MSMAILPAAAALLRELEKSGFAACLVGGCVRDLVRGETPHDWDVSTNARPEQLLALFPGSEATGLAHGGVTVPLGGRRFEVTTWRVDGAYSDHRRPDRVFFTDDLCADLARRDFTMNALALHLDGRLTDPFDGRADILARRIRCVGEPRRRFSEDALRLLRAARFSAQLGFTLEAETAAALHEQRALLAHLSAERAAEELRRLLRGRWVAAALPDFSDLLTVLLPALAGIDWPAAARAVAACPSEDVPRLAALCAPLGAEGAVSALSALHIERRMLDEIRFLLTELARPLPEALPALRRRLADCSTRQYRQYLAFRGALYPGQAAEHGAQRALLAHIEGQSLPCRTGELALDGRDLLAAGLSPGPEIGRALRCLLDAVIDGQVENERAALLRWLENNK